jgi:hypothetical protein
MMGRQKRDQDRLFYEFRLKDRIPENHLLRRIDVFVTAAFGDLHKELKPHYSDIGRLDRSRLMTFPLTLAGREPAPTSPP